MGRQSRFCTDFQQSHAAVVALHHYYPQRYAATTNVSGALLAARAQRLAQQLDIAGTATERTGRILIGTVENDIHDIGKSIFTNLALTEGYEVIDLGVDVKPHRFFEEALATKPDILAMSGIISNAIKSMTETVNLFKKNYIRNDFKIIIGGLSLSEDLLNYIGADFATKSAETGITKCNEWMREKNGQ